MKKFSIFLSLFLLYSCVIHKPIYDSFYEGEPNYKSIYVVDTIKIEDHVIISSKYGRFVIARKILDEPNLKIDKNFYKRPDVFILVDELWFDYVNDYYKYPYPDSEKCSIEFKNKMQGNGLYLYEYKNKPTYFILCLINANYYNRKYKLIDGISYLIDSKDQKTSYYKIVYPLCK